MGLVLQASLALLTPPEQLWCFFSVGPDLPTAQHCHSWEFTKEKQRRTSLKGLCCSSLRLKCTRPHGHLWGHSERGASTRPAPSGGHSHLQDTRKCWAQKGTYHTTPLTPRRGADRPGAGGGKKPSSCFVGEDCGCAGRGMGELSGVTGRSCILTRGTGNLEFVKNHQTVHLSSVHISVCKFFHDLKKEHKRRLWCRRPLDLWGFLHPLKLPCPILPALMPRASGMSCRVSRGPGHSSDDMATRRRVRAERTLLAVAGSAGCPPRDTVTSGCAPGAGASLTPGEEASSGTCEVTGLVRVW